MKNPGKEFEKSLRVDPSSKTDLTFKKVYSYYALCSYILSGLLAGGVSMNFNLAFSVFTVYWGWSIAWKWVVLKSPNIYSIRVPTAVLDDWIPLSVPTGIELRKDRVVTSISEASGIRGCQLMPMLRIMTALTCALTMAAIHQDLLYRQSRIYIISSYADMVPVCMLSYIIGSFLTGHYELNKMERFHTMMHFIGVGTLSLSSLMIGFVTNWSMFSIVLVTSYYTLLVYYMQFSETVKTRSSDLSQVSSISKKCIVIENIVFDLFNIILVLTINGSGANEGNIFALQ